MSTETDRLSTGMQATNKSLVVQGYPICFYIIRSKINS